MLDTLLDPPFARTATFHANAKTVGLVLAVLSAIGLVFSVIGLPLALAIIGVYPIAALGLIASLAGAALVLYGGYQMYREDAGGKRWAIYGCVVYFIGSALALLTGDVTQIVSLAIIAAVYYVIVTSRFEAAPKAP